MFANMQFGSGTRLVAVLVFLATGSTFSNSTAVAQETKPEPKIEIVSAVFGTGRAAVKCETKIAGFVANPDLVTEITTRGMSIKNPSGRWRDVLRITYRIDGRDIYDEEGKPAVLTFTNGEKVNIYQAILAHAEANATNKPAPAEPVKPADPGKIQEQVPETEKVISLPGKLAQLRTGGAGRFLIFHFPEKSILAVMDVVKREIVKEIPVTADVAFAANREKLLIALPRVNQLQRWDLTTLERDHATLLDRNHPAEFAVMGSCGDGPLALFSNDHVQLWDVQEMKLIPENGPMLSGSNSREYGLTVSADGKTFCGWLKGLSPLTYAVMRFDGRKTSISRTSNGTGYNEEWVMPNTDGSILFQHGGKAYTRDFIPVPMDAFKNENVFPTENPGFIVSLRKKNAKQSEYTICTAADFRRVHTLAPFDSVTSNHLETMWGRVGAGLEPSFRYLPDHNVVVCIPDKLDRVVIRSFDLKAALDQSGEDYLFVTSRPNSDVSVGETFTYKPTALSNSTDVQYSLDAGPDGMTIDSDGALTWPVKNRPADGFVSVIMIATASNNLSSIHAFELYVKSQLKTELADASPGRPGKRGRASGDPSIDMDELKKQIEGELPGFGPDAMPSGVSDPAKPGEISPTPEVVNDTAIPLPGVFDMVRTGGEGRYLIFRIPEKEILAIFDLVKRETVKEIRAPNNVVFAASREKLLIAYPLTNQLQRWDLNTLSRDGHTQLDADKPPTVAVMGASGDGPLLIWSKRKNEFQLWDINQMKPISVIGQMMNSVKDSDHELSVSADGKSFCGGSSWGGRPYEVMRIDNETVTLLKTPDVHDHGGRWAALSGDGSLLLRSPPGAYYYDMTPIPTEKGDKSAFVPTEDPRYLLKIHMVNDAQDLEPSICSAADFRTIITLPPFLAVNNRRDHRNWFQLGSEMRLRYVPQHNLMACIAVERDRIFVRKFDLNEALARSRQSYLFVNSKPPATTKVGDSFEYQITTLSSSKVTRFSLDAGPAGMTVSSEGKVSWPVELRPLGGVAHVVIQAENADGNLFTHAFRISVARDFRTGVAGKGGAGAGAGFVQIDDVRLELPQPANSFSPGLEGRMLLLCGNQLAVLGADGWTVETTATLDKAYAMIGEREDYFVAVSDQPKGIYVLDKTTLKVLRSMPIEWMRFTDLVLHPTLPISYVAGKHDIDIPQYGFVVFDEKKGDGREDKDWIGNWIAVDPSGKFLVAAYSDTYRSGSQLLMNPERWHVIPEYGSLDWLIRYKLDRKGLPTVDEVKENVGGNGKGIRMSPDGKQVTYLSHVGSPTYSNKLAGWDTSDFGKVPISYDTRDRATTQELAYHPFLPIVASPGSGSAVFFNSENGEVELDRLTGDLSILTDLKVDRLFFSPDGKHLVFDGDLNGIHYLHKFALKLKAGETKAGAAAARRAAREAKANAVATTIPLVELDSFKGGTGQISTTAEIAKSYMNSVVVVESGDVSGSGFVVGGSGYLMTCAHCVPDPNDIRVTYKHSGGTATDRPAKLLAIDEEMDLALIQVSVTKPLNSIRLAIGHKIETGSAVSVIGNPSAGSERLDYTMTDGIVSSPNREIDGVSFVQSTAAVNPGSSGGPMFNDHGMVIGMVVLKARIEGVGFAIPADEIGRFLMRHLKQEADSMAIVRDWVTSSGENPVEAVYLGQDSSEVKIRKTSDGKEYSWAVGDLSDADLIFLKMIPKTDR